MSQVFLIPVAETTTTLYAVTADSAAEALRVYVAGGEDCVVYDRDIIEARRLGDPEAVAGLFHDGAMDENGNWPFYIVAPEPDERAVEREGELRVYFPSLDEVAANSDLDVKYASDFRKAHSRADRAEAFAAGAAAHVVARVLDEAITPEIVAKWRALSQTPGVLIEQEAPTAPRALTAGDLAEAFDCFWRAALGEARDSQDPSTMFTVAAVSYGFAAVATRLREMSK